MSHTRSDLHTEIEWHEKKYHPVTIKSGVYKWLVSLNPTLYDATDRFLQALGDIKGLRICEIGCGDGNFTNSMLRNGAYVAAIDISKDAIMVARKNNKEFLEGKATFEMMDACNLLYRDELFDIVVGGAILHHINITKVSKEIKRVLKPNGRALFIEPLAYNPIANLWRRLTPTERTKNEYPLSYQDIKNMSQYFSSVKYEEFNFLPMFSSLVKLFTFSDKLKNKSATWFNRIEPRFLRLCKPLRKYSAQVLIEFKK